MRLVEKRRTSRRSKLTGDRPGGATPKISSPRQTAGRIAGKNRLTPTDQNGIRIDRVTLRGAPGFTSWSESPPAIYDLSVTLLMFTAKS
jgi:hypothetical protein